MATAEDTNSKPWTCTTCCEDFADGPRTSMEGSEVCDACIHHLFDNSIASEEDFPPRWGRTILDPWDFRRVLNTHFLKKFQQREDEWTCPAKERIYCRQTDPPRRPEHCGTFLGRIGDRLLCRRCDKCMWYTCLRCLECFSTGDTAGESAEIDHECDPDIEKKLREHAFEGLARGADYQDCPNRRCERRIQLKDGCNHITCFCGTHYCYICGRHAYAGPGNSHWNLGGCPLYGQLGSGRGIHADDVPPLGANHDNFLDWQVAALLRQELLQDERLLFIPRDGPVDARLLLPIGRGELGRRRDEDEAMARRDRFRRMHFEEPDAGAGAPVARAFFEAIEENIDPWRPPRRRNAIAADRSPERRGHRAERLRSPSPVIQADGDDRPARRRHRRRRHRAIDADDGGEAAGVRAGEAPGRRRRNVDGDGDTSDVEDRDVAMARRVGRGFLGVLIDILGR